MTKVVAKMFIQSASTGPDGSTSYQMGVVCRGEENKEWSAATPSGSAKFAADSILDAVWAAHLSEHQTPAEILVYQEPHDEGEWSMMSCDFAWNGCQVKFTRSGPPYGQELSLNINAGPATKTLRAAYAAGLDVGKPPKFNIFTDLP